MRCVDSLHILQRGNEPRELFEAVPVSVNLRYRSVNYDRLDLGMGIECRGLGVWLGLVWLRVGRSLIGSVWFHNAIQEKR